MDLMKVHRLAPKTQQKDSF